MNKSSYEVTQLANAFHDGGLEQLDHLLLDEKEAKVALLNSFVMGRNVLFVGPPGGGKSTLSRDAYRLIEGIEPEHVAVVPHHSDLTPTELVGGSVSTTKETKNGGSHPTVETIKATIDPIIHEDTKVIWIDEINRVNPFAINASLGVLETGEVVTTAGKVKLNGLQLGVSTMNPSENRQATYPMTAAIASRHAMGAILGGDVSDTTQRQNRMERIVKGWIPSPDAIEPVIDIEGLETLRAAAKKHPIPENLVPRVVELSACVVDHLADERIHEADGRITSQIAAIARSLALLRSQDIVHEADLNDAVRYVVSARIGALMRKSFNETQAVANTIIG